MNLKSRLVCSVTFIFSLTGQYAVAYKPPHSSPPLDIPKCEEGFSTLKCAGAESNTLIGAAVAVDPFYNDSRYTDVLAEQFNYLTPENATKWGSLSTTPFEYDFTNADAMVDFAIANDMKVKAHALIWHRQLPGYINEDLSRGYMRLLTAHHIIRTARHFRGKVYAWDVVNEAFEEDGSFRQSIFLEKLGPRYVERAFRLARIADRRAKLIYNDFNIATRNAKSDAVYAMVKDFVKRRVPIDAVGFQMHFDAATAPTTEEMVDNLQRFADLGLAVNISELDVRIRNLPGSLSRRLEKQKVVYQRVANACQQIPACDGITSWGFTDRYSWIDGTFGEDDPLQYDEDYQKKPAFDGQFDGLLGIAAVDPTLGENIAPNPGFESGTDPWFSFGSTVLSTDDPVRSGTAAVLITDREQTFQGPAVDLTNSVTSGIYQASGWGQIRGAESDTLLLTAKIVCTGEPEQFVTVGAGSGNNVSWSRVSGAVVVPECNLEQFLLYMEGPQPGVDLIVDDMELRRESLGIGDNVFENSSFEAGTAPWFPFAGDFVTSNEFAQSGEFSARLSNRSATWNAIAYNATDVVSPGASYRSSVFARIAGAASDSVLLTMKSVCSGEPEQFTTIATDAADDSAWTELGGTVDIPDCSFEEILIYVEGPAPGVDLIVDDFELREEL